MCHYRTVGSGLYGNHMITAQLVHPDSVVCTRSLAHIWIDYVRTLVVLIMNFMNPAVDLDADRHKKKPAQGRLKKSS